MAEIYRRVQGKPTDEWLAMMPGVADWMDDFLFEAAVRAEAELIEHRQEGHASIDVDIGKIDRYLILNDERGQKAAMSIEYGREAYGIDENGKSVAANSSQAVYTVGATEGLFILHKAMRLKKRKRAKVKL